MQLIKSPAKIIKDQVVIYEVNLTIMNEVIEEFDTWLQKHVDKMLAIPGFVSASTSVIENNDEDTKQRSVQYRLTNQEALDAYLDKDAEHMRAHGLEKFPSKFTSQQRVLTPSQAALAEEAACANCGTQLEGRFCSSCGQREEPRVPTFMAMLKEATNALFGLESKLWRSIVFLFMKPGHLTTEYLSGKRQKYTTPFRIYLLFSIITFALVSILGSQAMQSVDVEQGSKAMDSILNDINDEIEKNDPENLTKIEPVNSIMEDTVTKELSEEEEEKVFNEKINAFELPLGFLTKELALKVDTSIKNSIKEIRYDFKNGNTDEVVKKFIGPVPKALLIFLPFIALAFKILYAGRGKYYIEHLVYLLHNHAFLFALIIATVFITQFTNVFPNLRHPVAMLVNLVFVYFVANFFIKKIKKNYPKHKFKLIVYVLAFGLVVKGIYEFTQNESLASTMVLLWIFYAPYYLYRSMRVVYKSSRFVTVLSYGIIFVTYVALFAVTAVIYIIISGLTYA